MDKKLQEAGSMPKREARVPSIDDMRSFELALLGAANSFSRWVVSCAQATGESGLGSTDLIVLKMISREARPKRATEIAFALNMEDSHAISYSLKKLQRSGLVRSSRSGKESHFSTTEVADEFLCRYDDIRVSCLLGTLDVFTNNSDDLSAITQRLLVISGIYEQAARTATGL